jgi:hypothetical protein
LEETLQAVHESGQLCWCFQLALPHCENAEPQPPKPTNGASVACLIGFEFLSPEPRICLGPGARGASTVPMPEAPVNEDCSTTNSIDDVWRPRKRTKIGVVLVAPLDQDPPQAEFRSRPLLTNP